MKKDREFAVLVGKAFLRELEAGHKESAVAFGRAFLLSLGMKGPEDNQYSQIGHGREFGGQLALVHN